MNSLLFTPNLISTSTPTLTLACAWEKGGLYKMNGWDMDPLLMGEGLIS